REEGGISVIVVPSFHNTALKNFSHSINALEVELATDDEAISSNRDAPTIFKGSREIVVQEGVSVPSFVSLATIPAKQTVITCVEVEVSGWIKGNTFTGSLVAKAANRQLDISFQIGADIELTLF